MINPKLHCFVKRFPLLVIIGEQDVSGYNMKSRNYSVTWYMRLITQISSALPGYDTSKTDPEKSKKNLKSQVHFFWNEKERTF